jgi:hypothetical protein
MLCALEAKRPLAGGRPFLLTQHFCRLHQVVSAFLSNLIVFGENNQCRREP